MYSFYSNFHFHFLLFYDLFKHIYCFSSIICFCDQHPHKRFVAVLVYSINLGSSHFKKASFFWNKFRTAKNILALWIYASTSIAMTFKRLRIILQIIGSIRNTQFSYSTIIQGISHDINLIDNNLCQLFIKIWRATIIQCQSVAIVLNCS